MKQFLLFAGDTYYPVGGWRDFKSDHDTLDEARSAAAALNADWYDIIDVQTMKVVPDMPEKSHFDQQRYRD